MKFQRLREWIALAVFVLAACGPQEARAATAAPAARPMPALARDAFARLMTVIGGARSIQYSSTIRTMQPSSDRKSLVPVVLQVSAKIQQPDQFRIDVGQNGVPKYVFASGSATGTVADVAGKRYAAFEKPDTVRGFQVGVQTSSRGMIPDAASAVFLILDPLTDPIQFNAANGAPPGTFATVAAPALLNGKRLTKIVQSADVEPGHKMIFRLFVDSSTGLPSHLEFEEDMNKSSLIGYKEDFSSWTIGSAPLDASAFDYTPPTAFTAYVAPPDPQITPLLANGSSAPDFSATTLDGKTVKLTDYAGKVVVLDFWATWCEPCQQELPLISKLSDEYAPKGVVFLAVCSWDQNNLFSDWAKAHSTWNNMIFAYDSAGVNGQQSIATKLYDVSAIPAEFIIGKNGSVVASVDYYDPSDRHERRLIEKALAQ